MFSDLNNTIKRILATDLRTLKSEIYVRKFEDISLLERKTTTHRECMCTNTYTSLYVYIHICTHIDIHTYTNIYKCHGIVYANTKIYYA